MNKRKLNFILIFILAIIWFFVIYKFVFPFQKSFSNEIFEKKKVFSEHYYINRDTFSAPIFSRDPFLNYVKNEQFKISKKVTNKNTNIYEKKINHNKYSKIWPDIEYLGFLKSEKSLQPLVLLKINGTVNKIKDKDSKLGISVIKIFKDTVVLFNGIESKNFVKK
ncbi:hypothetical protein SAMN04488096_10444 [Mesonia phycicola]|uniref:Uncharacterized protein n=1 Tax=Mesonia phycicola TaxID=579105 RepID=A0A1M6DKJ1_9FLAO|nr:hypothetical protein [Mesonia phycicola]SHI73661.1 hypothetical protein SAMN04488096_10444 [Mesonia phycicola]